MKSMKVLAMMLALYATPAFADLSAQCSGGSITGTEYSVVINVGDSFVDSDIRISVNGESLPAQYRGIVGSSPDMAFQFDLLTPSQTIQLSYNQGSSQGSLTLVDGQEIPLFCSRY